MKPRCSPLSSSSGVRGLGSLLRLATGSVERPSRDAVIHVSVSDFHPGFADFRFRAGFTAWDTDFAAEPLSTVRPRDIKSEVPRGLGLVQ